MLEGAREQLFTMPARSRRWLSVLCDTAGDESAEAAVLLAKAYTLLGRLPESLRAYARNESRSGAVPAASRAETSEWRVRVNRLMGRQDEARGLVEKELRAFPGSVPLGLERLALSLESGDSWGQPDAWVLPAAAETPDPALRAQVLSLSALARLAARRVPEAAWAAAEAAKVVGDIDDDRLAERMETLRWLGEAESALDQLDDAAGHLQRGLSFALAHGQNYLQAYFSLALSGVKAKRGDIDGAQIELDYAEDAARRYGTFPVLARAAELRSRLCPLGVADQIAAGNGNGEKARSAAEHLERLSQRERQVAELVSAGHTNQQIARRLEISQKTVETYMSRIFGKLEICSRAQIALAVGLADNT